MPPPSFVVAGTQKAATTWLYECLHEHPQIFVPETKELHFFCDKADCPKSRHAHGIEWYTSLFPDDARYSASGELSIDYMCYDYVAGRLYALNPRLKVIFILRNPVDRAYSAYWMNRRYKPDLAAFGDFIQPEHDFVARGFYCRQIERYLEVFPRAQIKIMIYEDLVRDPKGCLVEIFRFLDADPDFEPASMRQIIAETKVMSPNLGRTFYTRLSPLLKLRPLLATWRFFKRHTGLKHAPGNGGGAHQPKYPPMDPAVRARLQDIYREENQRLFRLIDRDIVEWSR